MKNIQEALEKHKYTKQHSILIELVVEALKAADPYESTKTHLQRANTTIWIKDVGSFDAKEVHVLGFGKASRGMARAVVDALGDLVRGGIVIAPEGQGGHEGPIQVLEGEHPTPGAKTLRSSLKLLEYAKSIPSNSLVIVLVSGGGSALFEVPVEPLTIDDINETTKLLLRSGATIEELNAVRKHLSAVKGGRLLEYIQSRPVVSLIISDVIGDRLDTIASGPTVPDDTTYVDAYNVLRKYGLLDKVPPKVVGVIEKGVRGELPETKKRGDKVFQNTFVKIVASNINSLQAAARKAEEKGYKSLILTDRLRGEAREVGRVLAAILEAVWHGTSSVSKPLVLLAGGETTVTVRGDGVGGRNQELCLSLLANIDQNVEYVAVCMGTDGIDGVSPAAGAIIDNTLLPRAKAAGLDPAKYLENNDSYTFFKTLGRTIETGYTGTNVNDIFIAILP